MCILISHMQSSGIWREVRPVLCGMDNRDQGMDFELKYSQRLDHRIPMISEKKDVLL